MKRLTALKNKQLIKVITGVRRCGKSTLLEMYQDKLKKSGVPNASIVNVNLEDYDYYTLREPAALHKYIKERVAIDAPTYVFIDEIQHCREFPDVIDSLYLNKNIDIYITGSNAAMLSGEIATLISGRYAEISMLPLSFCEFIQGTGGANNLSVKYLEYLRTGSFPYAIQLMDDPRALRDYLEGIYNSIVVKDISLRSRMNDTIILESVLRFLFDSVGSRISIKKIADTLTSAGRKTDVKTAERYLLALMDSYVIYRAKRYDIKGKEHLKTLDKYYAVDPALRKMLLGASQPSVGHVLENIVYLELLRRGFDVYIGKVDDLEVDFVAFDGRSTAYYQVCATARDENTLRRELAPLQKITDNYPKTLLTLDEDPVADYSGIRRLNALEWLIKPEFN